jgi:hypothetical protein
MLINTRRRATRQFKIFTWIARLCALVLLIVIFVVTIKEFYEVADPSKVYIYIPELLVVHQDCITDTTFPFSRYVPIANISLVSRHSQPQSIFIFNSNFSMFDIQASQ